MVQSFTYGARSYARDYWMLDEGEHLTVSNLRDALQRRKFTVMRSTTNKVRLKALYARCQRGLMSYEGLHPRELKLYAAQRALPPILNQKETVKVLKMQLEEADDKAIFSHFSALPPEIRRIIYDLHFKYLRTCPGVYKYQPPITLASRHIRHESLPLFYERCESMISTTTNLFVQQSFNMALSARSRAFIEATSTKNFARIRMMRIDFNDLSIDLRVDLTNKATAIQITWYSRLRYLDDPVHQECRDRLLAELRKIGLRIAAREGPLRLRESDLELLHGTSWDILRNGG